MVLRFLAWIIIFLTIGCAQHKPTPIPETIRPKPRTVTEQIATAVAIRSDCLLPNGDDSIAFGTGVIIDKTHILTANHVVECIGTMHFIRVATANDKLYIVTLDAADKDRDIARLKGFFELSPIQSAPDAIITKPTLTVQYVCSVAVVPEQARNCGYVRMIKLEGHYNLVYDIPTKLGNSGGPLYTYEGYLLGVVTGLGRCNPADIDSDPGCVGMSAMLWDRPAFWQSK